MNEVVYNLLRKVVECPERISVKDTEFHPCKYKRILIDDKQILTVNYNSTSGNYWCDEVRSLTNKDCLRTIKALDHVTAMNIRRM